MRSPWTSGETYALCHYEDVEKLKGSKYVQSEMGDLYQALKKDVLEGLTVLFIGTPCQVAGVKNYLRQEYDNLLTVDLICHGVPSQQSFARISASCHT